MRLMRKCGIALLMAGTLAAQTGQGVAACDRACLEGFVNQYLDALVARNLFGLPLAPKVKFTENGQVLELGNGLGNVATGIGTYKLYVSDPQSGQAGFLGTMRENGTPIALALRLKIENRKISEIETVVLRGTNPNLAVEIEKLGKPDAAFLETVPRAQRLSREAMIRAANRYFDAIENGTDNGAFTADCERVGNGVKVTHNPELQYPGFDSSLFRMGCAEQVATRMYSFVSTVYPRRLPVIDEERQLVFSFSTFQVAGDVLTFEWPGRGKFPIPDAYTSPFFMSAPEVFRLQGGKVKRAENLVVNLPYGTPDPFFKDDWRRPKK